MNKPYTPTGTETLLSEGDFGLCGVGEDYLRDILAPMNLGDVDRVRVETAYKIAIQAHSNQRRQSGKQYIEHVEYVVREFIELAQMMNRPVTADDLIVALLHDVLEDQVKYFDDVVRLFGYDIVYRIICLSKPNRELFDKWKSRIPEDTKEKVQLSPLYLLWQFTLLTESNLINQNDGLAYDGQLNVLKHFVSQALSKMPGITPEIQNEADNLMLKAQKPYKESIVRIQQDRSLNSTDKQEKCKKRWIEYAASLQLFLLSTENLPIKFADKIHNLSDVEYRQNEQDLPPEDREARGRKTKSILRTVDIYSLLSQIHKFPSRVMEKFYRAHSISVSKDVSENVSQVVSLAAQPSS